MLRNTRYWVKIRFCFWVVCCLLGVVRIYLKLTIVFFVFVFRPIGIPSMRIVYVFNPSKTKSLRLNAISARTSHFHSSFFDKKVGSMKKHSYFTWSYLLQKSPIGFYIAACMLWILNLIVRLGQVLQVKPLIEKQAVICLHIKYGKRWIFLRFNDVSPSSLTTLLHIGRLGNKTIRLIKYLHSLYAHISFIGLVADVIQRFLPQTFLFTI